MMRENGESRGRQQVDKRDKKKRGHKKKTARKIEYWKKKINRSQATTTTTTTTTTHTLTASKYTNKKTIKRTSSPRIQITKQASKVLDTRVQGKVQSLSTLLLSEQTNE
jgi:hypothetical protein